MTIFALQVIVCKFATGILLQVEKQQHILQISADHTNWFVSKMILVQKYINVRSKLPFYMARHRNKCLYHGTCLC